MVRVDGSRMKKIRVKKVPEKWVTLTMYTHDDGDFVDVICEVSNGVESEWMDSKYDSFFLKDIWPHKGRLQHAQENALRAYGYIPSSIIIMECNESEFQNLRR